MTSSNLLDLHDRQVGGLRALEDAARINAELPPRIRQARSIAHQPPISGKLTPGIGGRDRVARRQEGSSWTRRLGEKWVPADEECIEPLVRKSCCEGPIDLAACAGIEHFDLQSDPVSGRFHVPQRGFGRRGIRRIDEHGNARSSGDQFAQEFQPLCHQLIR